MNGDPPKVKGQAAVILAAPNALIRVPRPAGLPAAAFVFDLPPPTKAKRAFFVLLRWWKLL